MLKSFLPLLFIVFFVHTKTLSQCVITTTETSTNWFSALGPGVTTVHSHGQQIKVCEGGTMTNLAMSRASVLNVNTTGKLEFYRSSTSFSNLVWTVDGFGSEAGPYTYTFTDNLPLTGRNYYCFKQQDYDGRFEYSHISHVDTKGNGDVQIYPNPVSDKLYISGIDEDSTFSITDINSRIRAKGTITDEHIDVSGLLAGSYVLRVDNGGMVSHHQVE